MPGVHGASDMSVFGLQGKRGISSWCKKKEAAFLSMSIL